MVGRSGDSKQNFYYGWPNDWETVICSFPVITHISKLISSCWQLTKVKYSLKININT